jgi:membrane protein implicated in regulation of membrane protease activity
MTWWSWMILGAVILGAELFAIDAQFYLVFLGLSAAVVGVAGLVGVSYPELVTPEWAQWTAFATLSLLSFFTFRKSLYQKIHAGASGFNSSISGESVDIVADLEPGNEARVEYRGSRWTVRNSGANAIAAGTRAKVVKVDGLTLHVEAE